MRVSRCGSLPERLTEISFLRAKQSTAGAVKSCKIYPYITSGISHSAHKLCHIGKVPKKPSGPLPLNPEASGTGLMGVLGVDKSDGRDRG